MRTEPRRRTAPQLFTVVELQELGFSHGFSDYLSQSINYHGLQCIRQSPGGMYNVTLCVSHRRPHPLCALRGQRRSV
jgi:hypothetical protein